MNLLILYAKIFFITKIILYIPTRPTTANKQNKINIIRPEPELNSQLLSLM